METIYALFPPTSQQYSLDADIISSEMKGFGWRLLPKLGEGTSHEILCHRFKITHEMASGSSGLECLHLSLFFLKQ